MKEKKNVIIVILVVAIIGVLIVDIQLVFKIKPKNQISFNCTYETREKENLSTSMNYEFTFSNNDIQKYNLIYIFQCKDINCFHDFDINPIPNRQPIKIEQNESELTRKYIYNFKYPFADEKNIQKYVDMVEATGFKCYQKM